MHGPQTRDATPADRNAIIAFDHVAPLEPERIVQLTSIVLERNPETPVLLKADFRVAYGDVVSAMVLLQRGGAQKVGFLTDPAELDFDGRS